MMPRLILGLLLLIGLMMFISWFRRAPPAARSQAIKRIAVVGGLGTLLVLAVTGRVHWIFAALGAAVPLVQRILAATQMYKTVKGLRGGSRGPSPGKTSEIQTRFLRMSLDHDTGEMTGEVLEGRFRGQRVDQLSLDQLLELLKECRAQDEESATVLVAYLDRTQGEKWRERDFEPEQESQSAPASGSMTREDAFKVLGLEPTATREEIIEAHRRLMQKLHPDRGGSDFLAAKINQAKDILLDH